MTQPADPWRELQAWSHGALGELFISGAQWNQLHAYIAELQLWNRRISLVSQSELAVILIKHLADSLCAAARIKECGERVADLGSGAGFPGIPIAIVCPTAHVLLVESVGKKVSFLEAARRAAGLTNLQVFEGRIEVAARQKEYRGVFDVVISRALAKVDTLRQLASDLLRPGGRLLAMTSFQDSSAGEAFRYHLPDGTPRQIITWRSV